ncbi:hypothetical protein NPIL_605821 [Nephila pilipes]|uniref:Uncharacterized protein n=1 Tax=Nephila pilipes TaxID=299642 RepID=A0A8X6MYU7_NEPPI|nr:hypothetical protein NPIL_605821 [Nephila pilipes]
MNHHFLPQVGPLYFIIGTSPLHVTHFHCQPRRLEYTKQSATATQKEFFVVYSTHRTLFKVYHHKEKSQGRDVRPGGIKGPPSRGKKHGKIRNKIATILPPVMEQKYLHRRSSRCQTVRLPGVDMFVLGDVDLTLMSSQSLIAFGGVVICDVTNEFVVLTVGFHSVPKYFRRTIPRKGCFYWKGWTGSRNEL